MTANPLVGTWRLVSVENRDSEGSVTYPFGRNPVGSSRIPRTGAWLCSLGAQTVLASPSLIG
jgi:hypothetical protein